MFVLWYRRDAQTAMMVHAGAKAVHVAVTADDEATRILLGPAALSVYLSKLGGCHRTCKTSEVFIVGVEIFDFFHDHCVGGGDRGGSGGEFL